MATAVTIEGEARSNGETLIFLPKIRLRHAFSFSLAMSPSSYSSFPFPHKFRSNLSLKSSYSFPWRHSKPSPSQKLAADLLSLFGSNRDAARVPADEARQLRSCLHFLVPPSSYSSKISHKVSEGRRVLDEDNEMVWWPPAPVMELARLAVDSGGDPGTIERSLDPAFLPVPDVEGLKKDKCQITRTPNGRRFASKDLNSYFEFLFELIVERAPSVGMNVTLTRYDLFHGHLFLASDSGRLGILFHAREYPAYEKEGFPYNLGFCQAGTLIVLDAHPGGIIYKNLIPYYVDFVRTIYEDDFGEAVVDINYLNVGNAAPGERIFIC